MNKPPSNPQKSSGIEIRIERPSDIESISSITAAAFANHPYSHQTEPFIINALRADGALTISLVADLNGKVVGHIAFSRVAISDGSENWYALGPVSVSPEMQNRGIGSDLVREGLAMLKALGAKGCVLVGEPAYYTRFGFANFAELTMEGVPPQYILALPIDGGTAKGAVTHHPAFSATN